jgi:hypothetical protein
LQGVLESRKKLFEQLLWEHRGLSDAHAALQLTHSQCRGLFYLTGFFYTSFAFVHLCESVSFRTAALPESSQLDELISRVAALQGLFHLSVSFPSLIFQFANFFIPVSSREGEVFPPAPEQAAGSEK